MVKTHPKLSAQKIRLHIPDVFHRAPQKDGIANPTSKPKAILSVLEMTLTLLVATVDGVPIPGLKGVFGGTLAVIKSTKVYKQFLRYPCQTKTT